MVGQRRCRSLTHPTRQFRFITCAGLNKRPNIVLEDINDESEYRIHIPMDLYIKLGQRKKNLRDPRPGPKFTAEELALRVSQRK